MVALDQHKTMPYITAEVTLDVKGCGNMQVHEKINPFPFESVHHNGVVRFSL